MRGRVVSVVLGGLSMAGCLDVPPHQPCGPADLDCDGWPATSTNPAAADCDDRDPAINPGAAEDPATAADDDCLTDGAGARLVGVTGGVGGWTSGPLAIAFDSPSKMPSSLTVDGDELLVTQTDLCPVTNEEGMGVSLWPALAAHARVAVLSGTLTVERAGPALATSRIDWTATASASAPPQQPACASTTTVTGVIRFSVLPGGRLVRDDSVTLSAAADGCRGCANAATMPVLSSYLVIPTRFGEVRIDSQPPDTFPMSELRQPSATRRVCVRDPAGGRGLWLTWASARPPLASDGLRLRPIIVSQVEQAHALVWDFAYRRPAEAGEHRLTTTLVPGTDGPGPCGDADADTIGEVTVPPQLDGLRYVRERGTYEPEAAVTGALTFQALGAIDHGVAVRATGYGDHGVTVWRQAVGGRFARLERERDYLYQREADGAVTVWLSTVAANDTVTIAEPGHEPAP